MCVTCQALADTTDPVSGIAEDCPALSLDSGNSRSDTVITVHFVGAGQKADAANDIFDPSGSDEIVSEGWTQYEIDRAMAALATISNYIDVRFEQTISQNADFQMVLDDNEFDGGGFLGYFYQPAFAGDNRPTMGAFNSNGFGWSTNGLLEGGLGFSTIIHEALHGLGLDHPHDGQSILPGLDPSLPNFPFGYYGDHDLNQGVYTIMSYNDGLNRTGTNTTGNAATPMALDIAILQEIYGANTTFANGSDTYELEDVSDMWVSIWDTGGTDAITYGGTEDTVIDLREATLQPEVGGGGFISAAGNASRGDAGGYTIANGAVIENASSGSGDDTLIGNNANNVLTGNAGNDDLFGGFGEDELNGGNNNDLLMGGAGDDEINTGSGNDTAEGNSGEDDINVTSGTNTIYGGSGNDDIDGGTGADTVFGGSGDDDIFGGNGNDNLFGGRGDDTINGGNNNDTITGGLGQDTLTGGGGADDFVFEFASDSYAGAGNRDTITDFQTGTDDIDLSNFGSLSFANDITLNESGGNTVVGIDTNGDNVADMEIFLEGTTGLTASDFIL